MAIIEGFGFGFFVVDQYRTILIRMNRNVCGAVRIEWRDAGGGVCECGNCNRKQQECQGVFLLQASINPAAHTDNHSFIYGAHDKQKRPRSI
ncbi:hypothetical protein [Pseudomonas sp. S2_F03]